MLAPGEASLTYRMPAPCCLTKKLFESAYGLVTAVTVGAVCSAEVVQDLLKRGGFSAYLYSAINHKSDPVFPHTIFQCRCCPISRPVLGTSEAAAEKN
jgi:hypothetical protein